MDRPNIVLIMCDDLGYGDVGFNGNNKIRTPHLDAMAAAGITFTRFMAGGPVCSPTRGTCLTGRHYIRYGINHANEGSLPDQEITITDVAKANGYRTGHFGKWHLGTLTKDTVESRRGGREDKIQFYAPPWDRGFDVCFSTEARVPTWDPMKTPSHLGDPSKPFGTHYWNHNGEVVSENLDGDDSRVIMDRAVSFISSCVSDKTPFFSVIWFHTPHEPVVAGPEYLQMYSQYPENFAHYYGCVTAMDEQIGRLRRLLSAESIEEDTMVWFCSDNGPEGVTQGDPTHPHFARSCGSTAGLRGRKRSLFNGGITVPGCMVWPRKVDAGRVISTPCSTLDYFPTIADTLSFSMPDARPIDGESLLPVLEDRPADERRPIPFRFLNGKEGMAGSPTVAVVDGARKYLTNLTGSNEDLLFDIECDRGETESILDKDAAGAAEMKGFLEDFIDSARKSHRGDDYPEPFEPTTVFQEPSDW